MWVVPVVWAARIICAQEFKVSFRNKARSRLKGGKKKKKNETSWPVWELAVHRPLTLS